MGKNCSHLADHFTNHIFQKFGENEQLGLVFIDTTSYVHNGRRVVVAWRSKCKGTRRFFVPAKQP